MNIKKVKQNKVKPLRVRLTNAQHAMVMEKALERDLPMSTYVRMVVCGDIKL